MDTLKLTGGKWIAVQPILTELVDASHIDAVASAGLKPSAGVFYTTLEDTGRKPTEQEIADSMTLFVIESATPEITFWQMPNFPKVRKLRSLSEFAPSVFSGEMNAVAYVL